MEKTNRKLFNDAFSTSTYQAYLDDIDNAFPGALDFRSAESPVFVPAYFTDAMLQTCEEIIDVITDPRFKEMTERSIPTALRVPGENQHTHFIAFDFGICEGDNGLHKPQLIEMQGFPSLFGFEIFHDEITRKHFPIPSNYSAYLNGYSKDTYVKLLKDIIVGNDDPSETILLEIYPEKQKTRIDFYATKELLGIEIVCLTKLKADGRRLYYEKDGKEINVKRIYNRVIFDDLAQQEGLGNIIDLQQEYDVEWITHPNWFYRISKFTLPFLDIDGVPDTFFLNEMSQPVNLADYVLKPLFSFAGMGVIIDLTDADIDAIPDPENWILQKKVTYAPVIETPDEPAKAEIRLFYFWKDEWSRPVAVHNLARLSKGKMIGTRYNKDKTWVGGSIAYLEQ
jgi:hypothetical protein